MIRPLRCSDLRHHRRRHRHRVCPCQKVSVAYDLQDRVVSPMSKPQRGDRRIMLRLVSTLSPGGHWWRVQVSNRYCLRGRPFNSWGWGWVISGHQEFFFLAIWWAGYFFPFFPISSLLHLCCMQFFSSDKRLQEIFFQNHPPPPSRVKWSAPSHQLGNIFTLQSQILKLF